MGDNIKVSIKVRPLIKREKENKQTNQWKVQGNTISQINNYYSEPFEFGKIILDYENFLDFQKKKLSIQITFLMKTQPQLMYMIRLANL